MNKRCRYAFFVCILLSSFFVACGDSSSASDSDESEYDSAANTLKDLRDGHVYRTVKIGGYIWMAENLNFKAAGSFCYNDDEKKCAEYGRLYTWASSVTPSSFVHSGIKIGLRPFSKQLSPFSTISACPSRYIKPIIFIPPQRAHKITIFFAFMQIFGNNNAKSILFLNIRYFARINSCTGVPSKSHHSRSLFSRNRLYGSLTY